MVCYCSFISFSDLIKRTWTWLLFPLILFTSLFLYQLFCTQGCPERMCTNGTHRSHARCHPYPIAQPLKVGHTIGVYDPYSFRIMMWVLLRPTRTNQWKCYETGPTVFRPYPRRLESLTICRCHYKGSTFFSVIQRPSVLVRPGFEPATSRSADRCSTNWANQTAVCLVGKDVNKMWNDIYRAIAEVMTT